MKTRRRLAVFPAVMALATGPALAASIEFSTHLATPFASCSYTPGYGSCTQEIQPVIQTPLGILIGFRVVAQASADGGAWAFGLYNGRADFDFGYDVPYRYARTVALDMSGPVARATFPLVEYRFDILLDAAVTVAHNAGADESAYVWTTNVSGTHLPLKMLPGTGATVASPGPRHISRSATHVGLWDTPAPGDIVDLVPGGGGYLQQGDGIVSARGSLDALSNGGPYWPVMIDGGEAIACLGLQSTLSSFDTRCGANGLYVTAEWTDIGSITYPVTYLGGTSWQVTAIPLPGSLPLLLSALGLFGVCVRHRRRERTA